MDGISGGGERGVERWGKFWRFEEGVVAGQGSQPLEARRGEEGSPDQEGGHGRLSLSCRCRAPWQAEPAACLPAATASPSAQAIWYGDALHVFPLL